jgi:hypothetical protein
MRVDKSHRQRMDPRTYFERVQRARMAEAIESEGMVRLAGDEMGYLGQSLKSPTPFNRSIAQIPTADTR